MKLSSIRTLSAAFALFCLAAFSAASAKADTITTFQATGAFNGAGTLSGTLTIDITTGTLIDSAIQVANDSFSGF
ncbi:MAG: hypothetical protein ACRD34_01660, partial [Bryobacteraceae bacterium]